MTETVNLKRRGRDIKGAAFKGVLLFSLIVGFVTLVTLLVDVVRTGWSYVDKTLFTNPRRSTRRSPARGPRSWRRSTSASW